MPRTVLLIGAHGFIGGFIAAALRGRGHRVVCGVRAPRADAPDERRVDFTAMTADDWRSALQDVDAVVNAAGILREQGRQRFEQVHVAGPTELARRCVEHGIARFVQVSALGHPQDGAFIASKHRFDAALLAAHPSAVVLRPSLVYATSGSYGGTSLLRALAAFPGAQLLPGRGDWSVQPVAVEDLGALVARAVDSDATGVYELGGPAAMSLRAYQQRWRHWLRIPGMHAVAVPQVLVALQVRVWEALGHGPVGLTMWRMLQRGSTLSDGAFDRLHGTFGFAPRALDAVLGLHPSQMQDRWQAQLYFLGPALKLAVVVLWLLSGWTGFAATPREIGALVHATGDASAPLLAMARVGAGIDIALALWLASGWRPRLALALMAACVVVYTLVLGIAWPWLWLDPAGGLAKNLVLLPALAVLWVLVDRR